MGHLGERGGALRRMSGLVQQEERGGDCGGGGVGASNDEVEEHGADVLQIQIQMY